MFERGCPTLVDGRGAGQAALGPFGPLHTLRFEALAPYEHPSGMWVRERAAYRARCWDTLTTRTSGLGDRNRCSHSPTRRSTSNAASARRETGPLWQSSLITEQTFVDRPHPDSPRGPRSRASTSAAAVSIPKSPEP